MMRTEPRRLHPLYMLFSLGSAIKGFVPIFVIIGLRKTRTWGIGWLLLGVLVLAVVLVVSIGLMGWRRFTYTLEKDKLVIRKGIWFRDEKSIYFSRIHSVNIEQPLLHRLFGMAQLKIETPGGKNESDGVLPVLAMTEAVQLADWLRQSGQPVEAGPSIAVAGTEQASVKQQTYRAGEVGMAALPVAGALDAADGEAMPEHLAPLADGDGIGKTVTTAGSDAPAGTGSDAARERRTSLAASPGQPQLRFSARQLALAAGTTLNLGLIIAFFAGIYSFADDFIPDRLYNSLIEGATRLVPGYVSLLLWGCVALLFAWLLSAVLYVVKYYGFTATLAGKELIVAYGFLEKKIHQFPLERIQGVSIKEGIFRQWLGYAQIELSVLSSMKEEQIVLHPFVHRSRLPEVLAVYVPQFHIDPIQVQAPKRAMLYYFRTELLVTVFICIVLTVTVGRPGLWSLLLIPLVLVWSLLQYHDEGFTLNQGQLTTRTRNVARHTHLTRRPQIVVMKVSGTVFQRRKRLFTMSVTNLLNSTSTVSCMDEDAVRDVWRWYSRDRMTPLEPAAAPFTVEQEGL
jgi:putative membrane protein